MKHYVYILSPDREKHPNWLYVGYTDDPDRRIKKHNAGTV